MNIYGGCYIEVCGYEFGCSVIIKKNQLQKRKEEIIHRSDELPLKNKDKFSLLIVGKARQTKTQKCFQLP